MKYGKVLTYKDVEEANKLIGKKVIGWDFLSAIENNPESRLPAILNSIKHKYTYPFKTSSGDYQFIREVIEEKPKLMTNRQLAEWCARGNGEYTYINSGFAYTYYSYFKSKQNEPVPDTILVRPWGSEEWVVPTIDIYERDCKGR